MNSTATPGTRRIIIALPSPDGSVVRLEFDPLNPPPDFATLCKWSGARPAQNPAPLRSKHYSESERRKGAPLSLSTGARASQRRSRSLQRRVLPDESEQKSSIEETLVELVEELEDARLALAEKATELALADQVLVPYWDALSEVKSRIKKTHGRDSRGALQFRPHDRTSLFCELDALGRQWGPTKRERDILKVEVRELDRLVAHIEKAITKQKAKQNRKQRRAA